MTGCRFDPCCDTRKCGLVPMVNRNVSSNLTTYQYSRVVKGGALKMRCVCFRGSSPRTGKLPKYEVKTTYKALVAQLVRACDC